MTRRGRARRQRGVHLHAVGDARRGRNCSSATCRRLSSPSRSGRPGSVERLVPTGVPLTCTSRLPLPRSVGPPEVRAVTGHARRPPIAAIIFAAEPCAVVLERSPAGGACAALPPCRQAEHAAPTPARAGSAAAVANVRVSRDQYREHVGPSLAANPRHPRQLLAACQGSPFTPEFIVTYRLADGRRELAAGGMPRAARGRAGRRRRDRRLRRERPRLRLRRAFWSRFQPQPANPDANRAVYVWRTDDGGRSFSAPVTLVAGEYSDHPWIAAGQATAGRNVYVAWGAGAAHTAVEFTRSTDGGQSFEPPRTDPGGSPDPLAGERGPPGGRRTGRPGLRGLRLDHQQDRQGT